MKPLERATARRLRAEEGMALHAIAAEVGVAVSSVSRWTRDIELTPAQQEALRAANPILNGQAAGQRSQARRARDRRAAAQVRGRAMAAGGDPLHVTGCMLYWAEGSKSRNVAVLTNADPDLLAVFVRFLRRCYDVPDHRIALRVNCYLNNGLSLDEIEKWWLERLGLPPASLRRSIVNRPSRASSGRRRTLVFGTARISVFSTAVVQSIYGAIQAYAGVDRPEWLD